MSISVLERQACDRCLLRFVDISRKCDHAVFRQRKSHRSAQRLDIDRLGTHFQYVFLIVPLLMEGQLAVDKVFFVGDIHSHKTFGRRTLTCIVCRSCKVGQYICLSLTVFYNITALFQLVICLCKSRLVGCGIIVQFRSVEIF